MGCFTTRRTSRGPAATEPTPVLEALGSLNQGDASWPLAERHNLDLPLDHGNARAVIAEAMLHGAQFPPVVVFGEGGEYWLAEGYHRWHAAEIAELQHMRRWFLRCRALRHRQRSAASTPTKPSAQPYKTSPSSLRVKHISKNAPWMRCAVLPLRQILPRRHQFRPRRLCLRSYLQQTRIMPPRDFSIARRSSGPSGTSLGAEAVGLGG
jgi:hypothetical protein